MRSVKICIKKEQMMAGETNDRMRETWRICRYRSAIFLYMIDECDVCTMKNHQD